MARRIAVPSLALLPVLLVVAGIIVARLSARHDASRWTRQYPKIVQAYRPFSATEILRRWSDLQVGRGPTLPYGAEFSSLTITRTADGARLRATIRQLVDGPHCIDLTFDHRHLARWSQPPCP